MSEQAKYGPPFDGKPCPACPVEVRGVTATVHNFLGEWDACAKGQGEACRLANKVEELRRAMKVMEPIVEAHFANRLHSHGPPLSPKPFLERVEDKSREVYAAWLTVAPDVRLDDEAVSHDPKFRELCERLNELGVLLNMNVR